MHGLSNMPAFLPAAFLLAALAAPAGQGFVADTFHADAWATPALHVPASSGVKEPVSVQTAEAYLRAEHARFKLPADLANLTLVSARESLLGTHYRFQQMLQGIPVEGAGIIVSLNREGGVYHVFNSTRPSLHAVAARANRLSPDEALDAAWQHLRVHGALRAAPRAELVYLPEGKSLRLAYRTLVATWAPRGFWEHRIDATSGEVIAVRDTIIHERKAVAARPDFTAYAGPVAARAALTAQWLAAAATKALQTAALKNRVDGTALVFDPDPRTATANDALLDSSPAEDFTAAYVVRTLPDISETNGIHSLEGPWVTITELETPTTPPSTTTNGQWTARRGSNAFNDAMCYFHIDQNQRYLQSLGFTGATGVQYGSIAVDSDGLDGDDNSYYIPGANTLAFGHGGVDDNEDADVILHEYGHAITEDIVPGWTGGDTGAIGEGFGDYWGGTYSYTTANGSTHHPAWAFSWDGHGADTWGGRRLDMTNLVYDAGRTYYAHENLGGIDNYSDQLWSAPLFQSFLRLLALGRPREEVDRIVIESFFHVGPSPTMRDMAAATVLSAQQLYPDGPHAAVFFEKFTNQLLLTALPLPAPTWLYPAAGEILRTGQTIRVRWDRQGALPQAVAVLQFRCGEPPAPFFFDAMEAGSNGWTRAHASGSLDWQQVATTSRSPSHCWFAGDENFVNDQYLASPVLALGTDDELVFWHRYDLEGGYDGGVVEISLDGGATWSDIGTNATQNGYNATLDSDGPLGTRRAFTGASDGFIQTVIPLAGCAGTNTVLRFRQSDDSSYGAAGWWIDDVTLRPALVWSNLATTATNVSDICWTLPGMPDTNYVLRLKQSGADCADTAWVESTPFVVSADADGDALPDAWEILHFGSLTNSSATTDGDADGFLDLDEYVAGTAPGDAASLLEAMAVSNGAGAVTVQWRSALHRAYDVARATDLTGGFAVIATNLPATPPLNSYTDTNPPTEFPRFYRIRIPAAVP